MTMWKCKPWPGGRQGSPGADLENMVNEAALMAARRGKDRVEMNDFEDAKDKVLMGTERKSMIISEEEKKMTAYHESGHTLVAKLLPEHGPYSQGHHHSQGSRARPHPAATSLMKNIPTRRIISSTTSAFSWAGGRQRKSSWVCRPRARGMTSSGPPPWPEKWSVISE